MAALGANDSVRLRFVGLAGANLTAGANAGGGGKTSGGGGGDGAPRSTLDPADPDGRYSLDLSVAAERAVAASLAEADRAAPADLMRGVTLDGRALAPGGAKAAGWPARLPARGRLCFEFAARRAGPRPLVPTEPRKAEALRRQFAAPGLADRDRLALVATVAPFVILTGEQIASLVATLAPGPDRVAAAAILFTRAVGDGSDGGGDAALRAALGPRDAAALEAALGHLAGLPWSRPTGAEARMRWGDASNTLAARHGL